MNLPELQSCLDGIGARLFVRAGRLAVDAPVGSLTPEIKTSLTAHKAALLRLIAEPNTVALGDRVFSFAIPWQEGGLSGDVIALDTETDGLADDRRLALASASDGKEHAIIHPDDIGRFLLLRRERHWVFHNLVFDLETIDLHLARSGEEWARRVLWEAVEEGRAHDTMIRDMLLRLGRHDAHPTPRNLGVLAREYADLEIDKEDPYRVRYGEIIGRDWADVERGFFAYAIKDAIATRLVYDELRRRTAELARIRHVPDGTARRWGSLTEAVQIKGALALGRAGRNGMHLDLSRLDRVRDGLRARLDEVVARLREDPRCAGLFKVGRKDGAPESTPTGAPRKHAKVLQRILLDVAAEIEADTGHRFEVPLAPKGAVSASTKEWADHGNLHPFLADWIEMEETAKLVQFCGQLAAETVHPRYTILVRTGRVSASDPNIQQMPRKGGFREMFVPSPGHFLLAVDYSAIELVTLAAVCEARYGRSVLADVLRADRDPHAYTAAILLGMDPDEFLSLKESEPGKFKEWRQMAKALNFGLPGGLGAKSLASYAHRTYRVEMTQEQAAEFRERMIGEVYPEWGLYLSDDAMEILAANLEAPVEACWDALDWTGDRAGFVPGFVRRIVRGEVTKSDGTPYKASSLSGVWDALNHLNRSEMLAPLLAGRAGSEELKRLLFHGGVATLTGRLRGRVSFCQARNTPFQGLAADGAKLALWRLMREGFRIVGFVHDEILVELPDEGGYVSKAEVDRVAGIMCAEMGRVLGCDLPVKCEASLGTCWSKDAAPVEKTGRDGKVFPWQPGE
jgi:DNA polymerase I-like protein with 3'-5' exonuclease and polymerase domains